MMYTSYLWFSLLVVANVVVGTLFPIAVILPLSGPLANVVDGITDIIQLAVEEVNKVFAQVSFPHQVTLLIYDSQGSSKVGVESTFAAAKAGAFGIIGEYDGIHTVPIALAANNFSMWQCSGSATAQELSNKTNFPFFYRTISPEAPNGVFMAKFIRRMNWKFISVMFTTGPHGTGVMSTFSVEARRLEINFAASRALNEDDQAGYSIVLDSIRGAGSRVIVFIGKYTQLIPVLRLARKRDMIGPDWVWIVSQGCSPVSLELKDPMYTDEDRLNINGILVAQAQDRGPMTQTFIDYAFRPRFPNRNDVGPYSLFYYDCLFTMAFNMFMLIFKNGERNVINRRYPESLKITDFLIPVTSFTGEVHYDGNGNREVPYVVNNLYNMSYTQVYELDANSTELISLNPPRFYSGTSDIPRDEITTIFNILYGSTEGVTVVTVVSIMISLMETINVYLWWNRNSATVRHMSFVFLSVISQGCVMSFASILLLYDIPTPFTCIYHYALNAIGNELILSAVIAKSYRILRIFASMEIDFGRRKTLKNSRLLTGCLLIVMIQLMVVVIWAMYSPPIVENTKTFGMIGLVLAECRPSSSNFELGMQTFSYIYNGLLLLSVLFLAFKTRGVSIEFRESEFIAYAVQILALGWLVMVPFNYVKSAETFRIGVYVKTCTTMICITFAYACLVGRVAVGVFFDAKHLRRGRNNKTNSAIKTFQSSTQGAVAASSSLQGNYNVKNARSLLGKWNQCHISLIGEHGILCLAQRLSDYELMPGELTHLRYVQYDTTPEGYSLCIMIRFGKSAYVVQYEEEDDMKIWANVFTAQSVVSQSKKSTRQSGSSGSTAINASNSQVKAKSIEVHNRVP